ncbi:hypothetical protein HYT52_02045 [Candidatus Woesearchaeota archaeon]|nr:hypothetical protein [Candidatus Woesearchaeota archaeon]
MEIANNNGGKMTLKSYNQSILNALGDMDLGTLKPMSHFMFHPLFAQEWIHKLEKIVDEVSEQKIPLAKVAKTIRSGNLRAHLYFILMDLKSAKIPRDRRVKIANFFYSVLQEIAQDDVDGTKSNICHTSQEVSRLMNKPFSPADSTIARLLGRLYTACYHLANGLYTDFYTDYSAENMGPYHLGKDHILVIKHFEDLKPTSLWKTNFPYKSVTIYCVYENVKFSVDAISCHSMYQGDHINGLKKYSVEVDGEVVNDQEEIKKIVQAIEQESVQQWKKLLDLNREDLKQKGLMIRCYLFKKMFDLVGIGWKPTSEMVKAVKGKRWSTYWKSSGREYWEKVLDPAIEFYG